MFPFPFFFYNFKIKAYCRAATDWLNLVEYFFLDMEADKKKVMCACQNDVYKLVGYSVKQYDIESNIISSIILANSNQVVLVLNYYTLLFKMRLFIL